MPRMTKPHGGDGLILTMGLLCSVGLEWSGGLAIHPDPRGFKSLQVHFLYRRERELSPVVQTGTAEAVRPSNLIIRLSACFYEKGHADEPTRTKRTGPS